MSMVEDVMTLVWMMYRLILNQDCLVLILSSYDFFRSLHEILSVLQSREKYFGTKCTLTLRIYPLRTSE